MNLLTISILLFSNFFIQISTSEKSWQSFYTKKIDDENNVWICFPEGQANITGGLNDQFPERLVVYLYKNPVTEEIKAFVPGPDKQALIPNFPASVSDTLKPITTELISSLFNRRDQSDGGSTKGDPIGLNKGKIKTINSKPADTKSLLNQSALPYQNVHPVDQPLWTYDVKPQFNPAQQVPQLYLQDGYPTFDFNLEPDQPQEFNLYDDLEYTTLSGAHDNKTQDNGSWQSTSKPATLPQTKPTAASEPSPAGPPFVIPEVYSPESINKYLTFDQWFIEQMKIFKDINLPDDVKAIDSDNLRSLVQKKLSENQLNIDATGLIIDADGIPINIQNLRLRPILIGNSFNYQALQDNQQITLPKHLPYLEGILVTLVYPPKILGVIPLGKTYVSKPDLVISKNKVANVDTPVLIKRYYTDSSSPIKPSNPLSVTVSPYINHGSFVSPVISSPKKPGSALNPFSVSGSLSSNLNLPFLSNLYASVQSPLFPKGLLNPQHSGVWIRRSNKPKKSEKLKHKAAKLIKVAKKLEEEATKLEHEAVKLEKVAKKEAKKLEHVAEKLEKEARKEAEKLKKEAEKLKKHAEKSKANKDCLTSCPEPKQKLPSGPKPPLGPKPESEPHPPPGPKPESVPQPSSDSKPKSGHLQTPTGPKPESRPQPPLGPKPDSAPPGLKQESGPQPRPGPKPKSGPQPPQGPKPKSGPQLPPRPQSESGPYPTPGPRVPLEPKLPPSPKLESGSHPPPSSKLESRPHPSSGPKSDSGSHLTLGPKPDSGPKPQSKTESEKSYRRLGSQDLPPYNLDWDPNTKNTIPSQSFDIIPGSRLKTTPGSKSKPKPRFGSNRVKNEFNDPTVYKKDIIYLDHPQKLNSNAGYLTATPYFGKWNFPSKADNNHPQLVVIPLDSKWNPQDPNAPQLNIRPLDNKSHFDSKIESNPADSKWHEILKIKHKTPKWNHNQNDGKYKYPPTHDSSSQQLIATPLDGNPVDAKRQKIPKIKHKTPKWNHNQNDGKYKYPPTHVSNYQQLIATPLDDNPADSKWHEIPKIKHKTPKWNHNQNDGKYKYPPTHDSSSQQLIATPLDHNPADSKWHQTPKINLVTPKWNHIQNDGKYKYPPTHDSSSQQLIAIPLDDNPADSKWREVPKINSKTPKWSYNQNDGKNKYPPTHDSTSQQLIATPLDDKSESVSKINNKSLKWGNKQNDSEFKYPSTQDTSFLHLVATPINSKWNSDSKIKNNPFDSKWSHASKTNKLPKWADNQNDYSFKNYPMQNIGALKVDPNSPWTAYIAAHKNAPHSDVNLYNDKWTEHSTVKSNNVDVSSYPQIDPHYGPDDFMKALPTLPPLSLSPPYYPWKNMELFNTFPKKNSYSPKPNNPDINILSRLGSPFWHLRPKSADNNARRTYDQLSAEIGTEESIEDFHLDNSEKIQDDVEVPSRRSDSPIKNVFKSLLDMVLKNLINEISGGGGKRRMTDEPIDINATATNPIELEGAEDDHPDFRIIGGSAATGSGSPLSNKGRSGVNLIF